MSEELTILKDVASRLNGAKLGYMISGSVAMNYYAQPRTTRDIDVVIVLAKKDVDPFVNLFVGDFYIEKDVVASEVLRRGMFNIIHNEYIIKVDFIIRGDSEYDMVAFERRRHVDVEGTSISIISPEDLILRKLLWSKQSGSELQMRDAKNILEMCDRLDDAYFDEWLVKLELEDIYKKAIS